MSYCMISYKLTVDDSILVDFLVLGPRPGPILYVVNLTNTVYFLFSAKDQRLFKVHTYGQT